VRQRAARNLDGTDLRTGVIEKIDMAVAPGDGQAGRTIAVG
jgi:hypothetical protein